MGRQIVNMNKLKKFNYEKQEKAFAYLLIFPVMLIYAVFLFYPVLTRMLDAFTNFSVFNPNATFVGLDNFKELFFNTDFFVVVARTFIFVAIIVSIQYVLGLIFALLLSLDLPYTSGLRNFAMVPWVLPVAATVLVFNWIFQPEYGLLNIFFEAIGQHQLVKYWFGDPELALPAVSIIHIWRNVPFYGIVLYAGLKGIPSELYEAASIDGSSFFNTLFKIKLPLIKKQSIIVILLHIMFTYNNIDIILLSTGGGPIGVTNMLAVNTYNIVWSKLQFGVGTASAIMMFLMLIPIALISIYFSNKD